MSFVTIDVETANEDMASLCQIGLVKLVGNEIVDEWKTYIDPDDYFCSFNVGIHGIDENAVAGAPCFADIADQLSMFLRDQVVISHTHFDRLAVTQAYAMQGISAPLCTWLDSAKVARRTWPQFSQRGYGLANICNHIGYEFRHHDALEDAKAAAEIMLAAMVESGIDVAGWLKRVKQPIDPAHRKSITASANPEGGLYGEVVVFTGALELSRRDATEMAAKIGCEVIENVTKKTTLLVVGDQDTRRLAGHEKSRKHRKAEALVAKGHGLRILRETDFRKLVGLDAT